MTLKVDPQFVRSNEMKMLLGSAKHLEGVIGKLEWRSLQETLQWMMGELPQ